MDRPTTCPECGSDELRDTKRILPGDKEINVTVCGVCHWASDTRVGRPPADRSKNVTLRRLMQDARPNEADTRDDDRPRTAGDQ